MRDSTLGGYIDVHDRPPAFEGSDGHAYSAAVFVDGEPNAEGRFGAAVLFVRWSPSGSQTVGHVETPNLVFGDTPEEAEAKIRELSLHAVKHHLDQAIVTQREGLAW
jgi:hypothetical protein